MPLKTAQSLAWNLAKTLMTIMVMFRRCSFDHLPN